MDIMTLYERDGRFVTYEYLRHGEFSYKRNQRRADLKYRCNANENKTKSQSFHKPRNWILSCCFFGGNLGS